MVVVVLRLWKMIRTAETWLNHCSTSLQRNCGRFRSVLRSCCLLLLLLLLLSRPLEVEILNSDDDGGGVGAGAGGVDMGPCLSIEVWVPSYHPWSLPFQDPSIYARCSSCRFDIIPNHQAVQ